MRRAFQEEKFAKFKLFAKTLHYIFHWKMINMELLFIVIKKTPEEALAFGVGQSFHVLTIEKRVQAYCLYGK
jgi:hypothetical protein